MSKRFIALCFPALLRRQEDGRYLILNRHRKPLGAAAWFEGGVLQALMPVPVELPEMTPRLAERLSCLGSDNLDEVYLYTAKCNPLRSAANMEAYLVRLKRLAGLSAIPAIDSNGLPSHCTSRG